QAHRLLRVRELLRDFAHDARDHLALDVRLGFERRDELVRLALSRSLRLLLPYAILVLALDLLTLRLLPRLPLLGIALAHSRQFVLRNVPALKFVPGDGLFAAGRNERALSGQRNRFGRGARTACVNGRGES